MEKIKLIDIYERPERLGIFFDMSKDNELAELFQTIGINTVDNYHSFDMEYIYNHSGLKTVSPMLQRMYGKYVEDDNGDFVIISNGKRVTWDFVLSTINKDIINFIIKIRFLPKWKDLINTIKLEYDVLSPYHMDIIDTTKEDNLSSSTYSSSNNSDYTNNNSTSDNTYGFNSTEPVPADTSSGNITNNAFSHTSSDTSNKREDNTARTISRNGNIGNRSMTELIEERRRLLQYQFINTVYKDLDSVLTRSKYF